MPQILFIIVGLTTLILNSCQTRHHSINGHWHEFINNEFTHCYKITDRTYSVEELSVGYKKEHNKINGQIALWSQGTMDYSTDYKVAADEIQLNDSVFWVRANEEEFINDLSLGLLVRLEPKEIGADKFDLPYDSIFGPHIFIGHSKEEKSTNPTDNDYLIELGTGISTVNEISLYVVGHEQKWKTVIVNADKDTPDNILEDVLNEIYKAGYDKNDVYLTAIDKENRTIGLVRSK